MQFNNLVFLDQEHEYFVNGQKYPSVSSIVSRFYKPFDRSIAKYVARSKGVTEQQILDEWKQINEDSITLGHETHLYAENYAKGIFNPPKNEKELGVIQFYLDAISNYRIVNIELKMYHDEYMYAGTADLILYNTKTEKYTILDWKTNKDVKKNYNNQKMYEPFNTLLDTPLNHYKIQLNLYKICLENKGFEVEDMFIVWIHKHKDKYYEVFKAPDYSNKLHKYFQHENRRTYQFS